MKNHKSTQEERAEQLLTRIHQLRAELQEADPNILSHRTGIPYNEHQENKGKYIFRVWNQKVTLNYPEMKAKDFHTQEEVNIAAQAMIMYYFKTADGSPLSNKWIAFSELPEGRFYNQAFQGYTGKKLFQFFKDDKDTFLTASKKIGGMKHSLGDAAYALNILPRVPILTVMWQGDEDFASSYKLLFDASVSHYLPTDVCAIAGSMLTHKYIECFQAEHQ